MPPGRGVDPGSERGPERVERAGAPRSRGRTDASATSSTRDRARVGPSRSRREARSRGRHGGRSDRRRGLGGVGEREVVANRSEVVVRRIVAPSGHPAMRGTPPMTRGTTPSEVAARWRDRAHNRWSVRESRRSSGGVTSRPRAMAQSPGESVGAPGEGLRARGESLGAVGGSAGVTGQLRGSLHRCREDRR
jgi:hypothetical protein